MNQHISNKTFLKIKNAVRQDLMKAEQQKELIQNLESYQVKLKASKIEVENEMNFSKEALYFLKTWYSRHKNEKINQLQDDINNILKSFFDGNYNLKLVKRIVRNNEVLELVDSNKNGTDTRSVGLMLSGAERQLAGLLVQITTLKNLGSNLLILDEAFSSFGEEEIKKVPELLEVLDDFQIIIIEHKSELFTELQKKVIELESINGVTQIKGEY